MEENITPLMFVFNMSMFFQFQEDEKSLMMNSLYALHDKLAQVAGNTLKILWLSVLQQQLQRHLCSVICNSWYMLGSWEPLGVPFWEIRNPISNSLMLPVWHLLLQCFLNNRMLDIVICVFWSNVLMHYSSNYIKNV